MRFPKLALAALGAVALAVPTFAAVKAMTLSELMGITTDTVHVHILAKSTFHSDWPMSGVVWTKLTVQGESLRTGEPVTADLVFLGSHDPADNYGTSEMPTLQDTRVGGEAVIFFNGHDEQVPGQLNRIFDLSNVYRVERSFGTPVVIGKGEGAAFVENVKLDDARTLVRQTHLALQASKAAAGK
jgi:hypothetical protein